MKKLQSLWKNKKRIWKEYRTVFLIELIFLGVACMATFFLIKISSKSWENRLTVMTQNIQSLVESNLKSGKVKTGNALAEQTYMGLSEILPNTDDMEWNSRFGVSLEFMDDTDNPEYALNIPEVGCIWTTYDAENREFHREWISLGSWFENNTSDGWETFQKFYKQEQGHIVLKKIEGYYNGNSFQIKSAEFGSSVHKNESINISCRQNGMRKMIYRVADLNCLSDGITEENFDVEQGSMDLFVYLPEPYIRLTLSSYPQKCQANASGTINGYNLDHYEIRMYADIYYLATHDGTLKNYALPIWLIGQGIVAFLIAVTLYMQKKRKELARLRNTFINAMAHEMKTPAAVIKNSAECLEEGIHPEKQAHYISMMQKEADHMNDLLMSMLAYTRLSDSFYELNKNKCSLRNMMEVSYLHYKEKAEQKNLNVIWDCSENTEVICDEKLITMVMDNFISNAVRFCRINGVLRFNISQGSVSVYNDGSAISDEQIKEIWNPMFKGDSARQETGGTSGMGLAISAVILKAHKASYGVRNISEGVEFYFKLPL